MVKPSNTKKATGKNEAEWLLLKFPRQPKSLSPISAAILVTIALILGGAGTYLFLPKRLVAQAPGTLIEKSTAPPDRVAAIGYLEPKGEVIHISTADVGTGARVEKLLVARRDRVTAGQVIAILNNRDRLQAAVREAEVNVQVAQASLDRVRAGAKQGDINTQQEKVQNLRADLTGQIATQQAAVERIKAELKNAETECKRYRVLYQEGAESESRRDSVCLQQAVSQKSLDETQANLARTIATLELQIKEAEANLDSVAEVRPVDVQVSAAELAAAKAALQQAKENLDLAYIRTPRAGQILEIYTYPGEVVGEDGIVSMGQTDQMYVNAEVYETDISRVNLGQSATITSENVTDELYGVVDEIGLEIKTKDVLGTDPVADADARVVQVKIRLNPEDSRKVSGLTKLQTHVLIDTPTR
jgi:HlyD family secretion protein